MASGRETTSGPDPMSRLLVVVRKASGLSQTQAGQLAGRYLDSGPLTQPKISRAEQGMFALTPAEIDAVARACEADAEQRRELIRLARAAAAGTPDVAPRPSLMRNPQVLQRRIGKLEASAGLIRGWQPEVVDGVLQHPSWTEAAFGQLSPAWWEARRERLQRVEEPDRTWHLIISEAVLRWNLGNDVMIAQCEHLISMSERSNVQLGIIDLAAPKDIAPPRPFHLYGRTWAVVATDSGTAFIDVPGDLDRYEETFEKVDKLALYQDSARALLRRIADDYRARGQRNT